MLTSRKSLAAQVTVGLSLVGLMAFAACPSVAGQHPKKGGGGGAQVAAGKKVYDSTHCAGCHAISGTGGKGGPELTHTGAKHNAAWLADEVKNPKGHNPGGRMPAYQDKLSVTDVKSLAAYLASLK
jgi:cytochrome c oxidase subunit 2